MCKNNVCEPAEYCRPPPLYRDGDHYAALRDAETSLYLNPTSQKAHRWRLKCLLVLGYQEECTRLLQHYQEMFPVDTTFVSKFKTEVAEHVTGGCG